MAVVETAVKRDEVSMMVMMIVVEEVVKEVFFFLSRDCQSSNENDKVRRNIEKKHDMTRFHSDKAKTKKAGVTAGRHLVVYRPSLNEKVSLTRPSDREWRSIPPSLLQGEQ